MEDLLYWIWISQIFSYGSDLPRELLNHFDSPKQLYDERETNEFQFEFLRMADVQSIKKTSIERAQIILDDCKQMKIKVIPYNSEKYPQRLRNIFGSPMVLYILGELGDIDNELAIGIVGTRYPTTYGLSATDKLAFELAQADFTIISGCAVGIDASAHYGALKAGGRTIGVLGCGLDVNYPAENRDMKRSIIRSGGALITEVPPKTRPSGWIFPIRNRIISALSLGILVTEAPQRSGALITAEHALEQGKDVFCLPPHDIFDAKYFGVMKYIRDGAKCICSAGDIMLEYMTDYPHRLSSDKLLRAFAGTPRKKRKTTHTDNTQSTDEREIKNLEEQKTEEKRWPEDFGDDHKKIFDLLTNTPQTVEDIVVKLEIAMNKAVYLLTELEIGGFAQSMSGNRYVRKELS